LKLLTAAVLTAGLLLSTSACSAAEGVSTDSGGGATTFQTSDLPVDTSTPTAPPALPDVSTQPPLAEQQTLTSDGYTVVIVDNTGAPVADPTGYTFVRESPAAGTLLAVGSTVTLTVAAPLPPAPVVVAPAPAPGGGATAKCNDGSLSYSQHRQGTCSHHGGVAIWY
jgi:beta-lactam-binding protein with PASTA domain